MFIYSRKSEAWISRVNFAAVLEEDGTDIEEDEILLEFAGSTMILLQEGEKWTAVGTAMIDEPENQQETAGPSTASPTPAGNPSPIIPPAVSSPAPSPSITGSSPASSVASAPVAVLSSPSTTTSTKQEASVQKCECLVQ